MTVTVTLSFDNVGQMVDFFRSTLPAPKVVPDGFVPTPILVRPAPTVTELMRAETNAQLAAAGIDPAPAPTPVAVETKPKRGRPRKENAASAAAEASRTAPVAVPAPSAAPAPAKTYTNVEALEHFKAVNEAKGMQACFDLLARYGAGGGFRDVKPEQYAAFVADCDAVVAGKDIAAAH